MKPFDIEGNGCGGEAGNAPLEGMAVSLDALYGVGGRTAMVPHPEFEDIIRKIAGWLSAVEVKKSPCATRIGLHYRHR